MAYQSNIPQANDQLSVTQSNLLNNFAALSTFLNVNHVDFNGADQGKHKWVTFPVQGSAPVINAGELGLYSIASALTGGSNQLNFITAAGSSIPFTARNIGWTYLPSGIIIKYGTGVSGGAGTTVVTFPTGATYPAYSSGLFALVCPASNITCYVSALTATTVSVTCSGAGNFNYLVLGV